MTAPVLPPRDRERLIGCLELWRRPGTPAERDAAAAAAIRILDRRGLTWAAVIAEPPPVKHKPLYSTWRTVCAELAKRPGDLRPWERRFVADLPNFPRISTKQRYVLAEIAQRVLQRSATP
jgi:hypothetical protein